MSYDIILTMTVIASFAYFLVAVPVRIYEHRGNHVRGIIYFLVGLLTNYLVIKILFYTGGFVLIPMWLGKYSWMQRLSRFFVGY